MDKPLRAGIIGCGGVSTRHAESYKQCEDTSLAAAADLVPAALDAFVERHGLVATYLSYEEMLEKEHLDIVSICTPPTAHLTPALAAAQSGIKAMLLEKPMALNLADADAIIKACESNQVKLAVGHQLRYANHYRTARRLIDEGAIGDVERLWGMCHNVPLQTNTTHTIDLLRFLAGDKPIQWVMGAIDIGQVRQYEGIPQEETGVGLFQFEDGPVALIESGAITPYRGYHHIYVDGLEGQIELSRTDGPPLRIRSRATGGEWLEPPLDDEINPVNDIVRAVRNGSEICSSGLQGRQTLELILALFESARTRQMVTLPLTNSQNPLNQLLGERTP